MKGSKSAGVLDRFSNSAIVNSNASLFSSCPQAFACRGKVLSGNDPESREQPAPSSKVRPITRDIPRNDAYRIADIDFAS
jgi:hypothetical protein